MTNQLETFTEPKVIMINKEDFDCAFKILELQTNVLSLKLQQIKLGNYQYNKELKVLDSKLWMLMKSITLFLVLIQAIHF